MAGMFCAAFALAGCGSASVRPEIGEVGDESASWTLTGRLAISNGRDGGSGELTWRQGGTSAWLNFVGALGRGSWQLTIEPEGVRLAMADGGEYRAANLGQLIENRLGWDLPVAALRFWVQGLPAPGDDFEIGRNNEGQMTLLRQQGWQVQFDGYHRVDDQNLRPRKITATRGEERVRLLIRKWQITPFDSGA